MTKKYKTSAYRRGRAYEEETVRIANEHGWKAIRNPLSKNGDIILKKWGTYDQGWRCELTCEQKVRKQGFNRLYKWLGDKDALIVKGIGRGKRLIVMNFEEFLDLVK